MIIQLFYNTDGYLGGWANPPSLQSLKIEEITSKYLQDCKEKKQPIIVEMTNEEIVIFHNIIIGRDMVDILPKKSKVFDLEIGNLKLKFKDNQSDKILKKAQKDHQLTFSKSNHRLNPDERMMKELFKI